MAVTERTLNIACPQLKSLSGLEFEKLERQDGGNTNQAILDVINSAAIDMGIIGEAILLMGTNPSADETIVTGTGGAEETWVFKVAAASAYQVTIGGDADATIANFVEKFNANTALLMVASALATGIKVQNADAAGGTAVVGTLDAALSETLGAGADVWNQDNMNATGRTNYLYQTSAGIEITTENIATIFTVLLPFTPLELFYRFVDATGLPKPSCTSIAEIDGNGIKVTVTSGGSAAVATDVICFTAKGNALV